MTAPTFPAPARDSMHAAIRATLIRAATAADDHAAALMGAAIDTGDAEMMSIAHAARDAAERAHRRAQRALR